MEKQRIIKDYDKLSEEIHEQIKLTYPSGYSQNLIRFTNKDKKRISVLPFETEAIYYLVRMTMYEAQTIIEEDDDYDDEGMLKDDLREEYGDKYPDIGDLDNF